MLVYFVNEDLLSNNFGGSGHVGVSRVFCFVQSCLIYEGHKVFFAQSAQNGISS